MAARLRGGLSLTGSRAGEPPPGETAAATPPHPAQPPARPAGLGEPPAGQREQAGEAELDTLRGELVRELDRMAGDDDGSACFRRIA